MNRFLRHRLVLQLLFTSVAAFSVATLSIVLISQAISNAERVVLAETRTSLGAAISELRQQYQFRVASDNSWQNVPVQARDVSLRGISETVLRSYPGVEGGYYDAPEFLGYAFPTHDTGAAKLDVPVAEKGLIVAVAERSRREKRVLDEVIRGKTDLLVIRAAPGDGGGVAVWAMKRLPGRGAPGAGRREFLRMVLVAAALISIAGALATGLSLARGVAEIKDGLALLEKNFDFLLPERSDELGGISKSINKMADSRRKLESDLIREDRLRALGRLTAGLAHEIRNPLNSIRLTVQLLEHKLKSNSIQHEDLRVVRAEVDRLNSLLNELLDLQRVRQPKRETQSMLPVLEHCVRLVERQAEMHNASVRLQVQSSELLASFDAQQLTQIVMNLLLNALEASPHGGNIYLRASRENGVARVEVQDEGPGLDPEQKDHLFEPFFTTKASGTGLGLAVSRELVRSQGGDLFYLQRESGACFAIELPTTN